MTDNNSNAAFYSAAPERRINPFRPELRSGEGGNGPKHIYGYASMFNKISRKLPGGFIERVDSRAFNSSKASGFDGAVCRWNHKDDFLLGTIAGRTCQIDVDGTGLVYDVVPPDTSAGRDVVVLMQRGDVASSSFAFAMPEDWEGDDWALSDFGLPLRTLLDVQLRDVAPVTTPAYPDATSAVRSVDGAMLSLAHKFDASYAEIRSLFEGNQAVKLFKRSDMPSATTADEVPAIPAELVSDEERKDFSKADRDKDAKKGNAMPDGSFPIDDEGDLHNAIKLAGNSKNPAAAKAHIKKRAAAMKKSHLIPDEWDGGQPDEKKSDEAESEERAAKASYKDLETCGECGAENQWGKHCTDCGKPMAPDAPMQGKHCPSCGSKVAAGSKRSEHECEVELRAADAKVKKAKADDDDEDDDDADGAGKGTETEGREAEDEDSEERADAKKPAAKPAKKSDDDDDEDDEDDKKPSKGKLPGNDKSDKVKKGEDQLPPWLQKKRSLQMELMEKRYDPYFFDDEEASTEDEN